MAKLVVSFHIFRKFTGKTLDPIVGQFSPPVPQPRHPAHQFTKKIIVPAPKEAGNTSVYLINFKLQVFETCLILFMILNDYTFDCYTVSFLSVFDYTL